MNDKYHAHLTFPSSIEVLPRGWKRTEIVLLGNREQTDIMLTKHYMCGRNDMNIDKIYDELKQISKQYGAIRIKLEKDNNFERITEENYLECHCKVKGDTTFDMTWVRSRNPKDVVDGQEIYFYNKRVRKGDFIFEMSRISDEILRCTGPEGAEDVKFEQVVFDSNRQHDDWWA